MAKDRTEINVNGASSFQFRQLISGGVSTTFTEPSYVKSNTLDDNPTMVESKDAQGFVINVQVGEDSAKMTVNLLQSSKAVIDVLQTARGKFFEAYLKVPLSNGKFQEYNFPLCKIVPKVNLNFVANTERIVAYEIIMLKPKATYTRVPTNYNNNASDGPYYWVMTENAAAVGVPTDTDGAVYTAVV